MRIVISQFMSLDGVVQAPGGAEEDTDGGFAHGGWSMPYFDPEVMGGFIGESMEETDALLFGRRTWETMAAAWPDRDDGSDPVRHPHEHHHQVRGVRAPSTRTTCTGTTPRWCRATTPWRRSPSSRNDPAAGSG